MRVWSSLRDVMLLCVIALSLQSCGGGGSGSGTNITQPLTVSGTASEGAVIVGKTVKLKDANGTSATDTTTSTTGSYTIDVTGLTAPFLITVTGTNGTLISMSPSAGTANINPITNIVVALAAAIPDVSTLFTNLTPAQISNIYSSYTAKSELVTTSMQSVLPSGVTAAKYFNGTISAGTSMDALFDTYQITLNTTTGITVKTKGASATTVLTIPVSTVIANANQPLPTIVLPEANTAPIANAGIDQAVSVGTVVALDGSSSKDVDNDTLTYTWAFTSKPSESIVALSSTTVIRPTFTADVAGTYIIRLVVNDGKINSTADTVSVTASLPNSAPVAVAGVSQTVNTGALVFLNGAASFDPNADPITYQWAFVSRPQGSSAVLSSTSVSKPYFVADAAGNYALSLAVSDGNLSSSDTVDITAILNTTPSSSFCCKVCTTGKPCGDSCISNSYTCHIVGGCAC